VPRKNSSDTTGNRKSGGTTVYFMTLRHTDECRQGAGEYLDVRGGTGSCGMNLYEEIRNLVLSLFVLLRLSDK